jgi:hypothetical protein
VISGFVNIPLESIDLLLQSVAGTEAANRSFGITLPMLREGRDRVLEHHRRRGDGSAAIERVELIAGLFFVGLREELAKIAKCEALDATERETAVLAERSIKLRRGGSRAWRAFSSVTDFASAGLAPGFP